MAKPPARAKGPRRPEFNHPEKHRDIPIVEPREPPPNFDLLSDELKDKLREDAKVKVEARERARAIDAFLDSEVERLERASVPGLHEEMRDITIDLALGNDQIILDGKWYMYGRSYKVRQSVYAALKDIIQYTHRHYAQTHNNPEEAAMRASQAIAKGGHSYATLNATSGQVAKF